MSFQDIKLELKSWEVEFSECNQRKPNADDINAAPQKIRDAYKKYWSTKKSTQNGGSWGSHVNKTHKIAANNKKEEKRDDLNRFCEKIAKVSSTKASVPKFDLQSNLKTIKEQNLDIDCSWNSGFKVRTTIKDKQFNFKSVNAVVKLNFKSRELTVDQDWLSRCNDEQITSSKEKMNLSTDEKFNMIKQSEKTDSDAVGIESNKGKQQTAIEINEENNFDVNSDTFYESKKRNHYDNIEINEENDFDVISDISIESKRGNSVESKEEIYFKVEKSSEERNHKKSSDLSTNTELELAKNVRKRTMNKNISPENSVKRLKRDNFNENKISLQNERKLNLLEKKMKTNSINDNFVRIDIKKKKFHRGKKAFSAVKYKRKRWAMKQKYKDDLGNESECFRCGQTGHWAKKCPLKNPVKEKIECNEFDVEDENEDVSPFLTLEEAAALVHGIKPKENTVKVLVFNTDKAESKNEDCGISKKVCKVVEDFEESEISTVSTSQNISFEAVLDLDENGKILETPNLVFDALKKFGYDRFRPGQEETIMRILSGLSTVLILSTGAGKSLCYQLPAYLYAQKYNCITLVISPLVSLMEDQVTGLPACLKAVCLHTNLTPAQRKKSLDAISSGKAHIILISPEMAVGGKAGSGLPENLPPVAFACIDEAHCMSEWSHNFRPSYLRLNKVLRERFKVRCILALTATATFKTAESVATHLEIPQDTSGIIRGNIIPPNLCLSVSRDDNKDEALLNLLKGDRFISSSSILIYCTRREQTERLATVIRTCLKNESSSGLNINAEAYHAGLSAAKRRSVQKAFMCSKLRIVVATVAFGMGLDKADVRSVIHYNMPRRFESYVQEIGRAGRDGKEAHCHLFLDSQGNDLMELRRHIYANAVDRSTLRKLVHAVFPPCKCDKINQMNTNENKMANMLCYKHEVALPIDELVQKLDIKEENISTLLCYLELAPEKWIEILNPVYSWCKVLCYDGPKQLKTVSKKCPPLAVAIAIDVQNGENYEKSNSIEFPIVSIASRMGWDSGIVKREIKGLEWNKTSVGGKFRKSGIICEFSKLAFHFKAPGNFNGEELDGVLNYLHSYVENQLRGELLQLETAFKAFYSVSKARYWSCSDCYDEVKSDKLKDDLKNYFDGRLVMDENLAPLPKLDIERQMIDVQSAIRAFLSTYHEETFTGRSIARIFSGIDSPCFPAQVWGRVRRFWRCHLDVDFDLLCKWATQEIIRCK